jgi:hypothetical protein
VGGPRIRSCLPTASRSQVAFYPEGETGVPRDFGPPPLLLCFRITARFWAGNRRCCPWQPHIELNEGRPCAVTNPWSRWRRMLPRRQRNARGLGSPARQKSTHGRIQRSPSWVADVIESTSRLLRDGPDSSCWLDLSQWALDIDLSLIDCISSIMKAGVCEVELATGRGLEKRIRLAMLVGRSVERVARSVVGGGPTPQAYEFKLVRWPERPAP